MKLPSASRTAEALGDSIVLSTFRFSTRKDVAKLLDFSKTVEMEWGRIVNELYVSGFVMSRLMLESIAQITENERQVFFKQVRDELFNSYLKHLKNIGVKDKHVKTWSELLDMRREEYWQDRNEHRSELPEPHKGNPWVSVVAISGWQHIRKGKALPDDPFFLVFLKWLSELSIDVTKILHKAARRL